jgi:uncharacterized protein (TIGR02677 family)
MQASGVFSYTGSQNPALYRTIMKIFMESKERFTSFLEPTDIFERLLVGQSWSEQQISSALVQLCDWGNLRALGEEPASFQITSAGEAAERALQSFFLSQAVDFAVHPCGVAAVRYALQELQRLSVEQVATSDRAHQNFLVLHELVEEFSTSANVFLARLQESSDLEASEVRRRLDVGRQFIDELKLESNRIADIVKRIGDPGFEKLLHSVADGWIRDSSGQSAEMVRGACDRWRAVWSRIKFWFVSEENIPCNAEILRDHAGAALDRLDAIVNATHKGRTPRVDRSTDFRILARWFAQTESDADAHRLWRAAFGLGSARHLSVDDATIEEREADGVPTGSSWLQAPPVRTSAIVKNHRSQSVTGSLTRIVDRRIEKQKLAEVCDAEVQRVLDAQRRFGIGDRIRLSELERLESAEFELLLDVLAEAVSTRASDMDRVEFFSADGSLKVRLEPTGDDRQALIFTSEGVFSGPDHWLHIEPTTGMDMLEANP